jgi:hypothetical protein
MGDVVSFALSLLEPFLGTWIRDPLSVSRNKVAKRMLGEEALKRLWGCGSMAAVRLCLDDDSELAAKYDALCRLGSQGRLVIERRLMTWTDTGTRFVPGRTVSSAIARVTAEGRKIIVHSTPTRTVCGHTLCKKNEWLLVSERYAGANVLHFPRSPEFRYYRVD